MKLNAVTSLFLSLFICFAFLPLAYGADYKSVAEVISHYKEQIVDIKDLDSETREFFLKTRSGKSPGIVRADFNGDGKEDVALLTKTALLLFICADRCRELQSENYGRTADYMYIVPIKKGKLIEEFGGFDKQDNQPPTPPVLLKNTAVHVIFYGKASVAYYWDSTLNNFNSITTGD
jgi:hypothetical protein